MPQPDFKKLPGPPPTLRLVVLAVAGLSFLWAFGAVAVGGFTWGLPDATHVQSYHPDEQNITYSLRNMNRRSFDFNPRFFGNPTFFTYQVGAAAFAASKLGLLPLQTGYDYWLSHPEDVRRFYVVGRLLSFAYWLASLGVICLVAKSVAGNWQAGFLAALLFGSLPVSAVHSHYMTVNASAVFWSLLTLLFAQRIIARPHWRSYIFAAVACGFAIATKLSNAFLPLAILAAALLSSDAGKKHVLARKLAVAAVVCFLAFFVGSPYYILSFGSVSADPHHRMNIGALFDFSTPLSVLWRDFWNHSTAAAGWVFAALLPLGLLVTVVSPNRRIWPLVAVAVPFLVVAVKSGWWAFPSRMWPLLAVLTVLLAVFVEGRSFVWLRIGAAAAVIAGCIVTIPWNEGYRELMSSEHIRAESSNWIAANIPAGEHVAVIDTPYYEEPDIIYENALHGGSLAPVKYTIVSLGGHLDMLASSGAPWLVTTQRYDDALRKSRGKSLAVWAAENGYVEVASFKRRFRAFGLELRDWVPADMVQDYPVYIFRKPAPE